MLNFCMGMWSINSIKRISFLTLKTHSFFLWSKCFELLYLDWNIVLVPFLTFHQNLLAFTIKYLLTSIWNDVNALTFIQAWSLTRKKVLLATPWVRPRGWLPCVATPWVRPRCRVGCGVDSIVSWGRSSLCSVWLYPCPHMSMKMPEGVS